MLYVDKVVGDKTGVITAVDGTRVFIETHSIRTQAPVNFVVNTGGDLLLPVFTTLVGLRTEGALYVEGRLYGIESLRLYTGVRSVVTDKGHTSCFGCNASFVVPYQSHYWFSKVNVMKDGTFELKSNSFNVNSRVVHLHVHEVDLDYSGQIKPDVVKMYTNVLSIEFDAGVDATQRGWPSVQGPGASRGCSQNVAGAGHGGAGGDGKSRNCRGILCTGAGT